MATLEQLEARQKQLQMQIQRKKRELAKQERKARNHALMVAGGLVMQHAPDGDWKRVDWDKLAAWLNRYGYKVAECEAEGLPTDEAYKRLREWEHPRPKVEESGTDVSTGQEEGGAAIGQSNPPADALDGRMMS